jgi:hypothetical protein
VKIQKRRETGKEKYSTKSLPSSETLSGIPPLTIARSNPSCMLTELMTKQKKQMRKRTTEEEEEEGKKKGVQSLATLTDVFCFLSSLSS